MECYLCGGLSVHLGQLSSSSNALNDCVGRFVVCFHKIGGACGVKSLNVVDYETGVDEGYTVTVDRF